MYVLIPCYSLPKDKIYPLKSEPISFDFNNLCLRIFINIYNYSHCNFGRKIGRKKIKKYGDGVTTALPPLASGGGHGVFTLLVIILHNHPNGSNKFDDCFTPF